MNRSAGTLLLLAQVWFAIPAMLDGHWTPRLVNRRDLARFGMVVLIFFSVTAVVNRYLSTGGPVQRADADVAAPSPDSQGSEDAALAGTETVRDPESAVGKLKVWVPAAIIGGDYWIYLDGHIVNAPPHAATSNNLVTVQLGADRSRGEGWELWGAQGFLLRMRHENYENLPRYIAPGFGVEPCNMKMSGDGCYLQSATGHAQALLDPMHVFQTVDLSLPLGKHTVEVAIVGRKRSSSSSYSPSFPFVITRKYVAAVEADWTTHLFVAVPDDWASYSLPMAAPMLCSYGTAESPPNDSQLQQWVKAYMDDPMVKALRRVDASLLSGPKSFVVLSLPQAQGGTREFDGRQIREIVHAIPYVPEPWVVEGCQRRSPQYAQSWDEYRKMVGVLYSEIESFRKLAVTLGAPPESTESPFKR